MTATLEELVQTGVTRLDARRPGWYDNVDLDTLNIADTKDCILGQLFGHFDSGVALLNENEPAFFCGFDKPLFHPFKAYGQLTEIWKNVILEKRAA